MYGLKDDDVESRREEESAAKPEPEWQGAGPGMGSGSGIGNGPGMGNGSGIGNGPGMGNGWNSRPPQQGPDPDNGFRGGLYSSGMRMNNVPPQGPDFGAGITPEPPFNRGYNPGPAGYGPNMGPIDHGYGRRSYDQPNRMEGPAAPKKSEGKKPGLFSRLLAACLIGLLFGTCAAAGFYGVNAMMSGAALQGGIPAVGQQDETIKPPALNPSQSQSQGQSRTAPLPNVSSETSTVVTDVSQVVEKVMPAMVSITNTFTKKASFFGQTFENEAKSGGSGIIVGRNDSELLIVTNQHVIDEADRLTVQFIDGSEADANIKGFDSSQDIAVIAVRLDSMEEKTTNAIYEATLGDSTTLSLGEPTIAIGNALGYGQSVTTGVVSALDRTIGDDTNGEFFIQTDAAINPGNSGGALLNIRGEVIGINSNKLGGAVVEGMGYAIPISRVQPLIETLMTRATREKAQSGQESYLGISGVDVTGEVAEAYGMPKGVYVGQVHEGTAAAAAGIETGDIIVSFDGSPVTTMNELQGIMKYYSAGDQVELVIQRGNTWGYQEIKLSVTLGKRDSER